MTSLSSSSLSSAELFSRRTAVIVRTTSSGDVDKASDLAEHKPVNSRAGSSTLLALVWCHLSARGVAQALLCEPNKALAETLAVTRKESNDRENEEARVL